MNLLASHFLIAAVTVSLQQIMQSVAEDDDNVEVCVDLVGATLSRSVTATLTPQPGTACTFLALKHLCGQSLYSTVLF